MHEIETKILDIDKNNIIKKIISAGGKKVLETKFIVDWFRLQGIKEGQDNWFLRIRSNSEGKHEVTWKAKSEILDVARKHKEINFIIQEPEKISDLFLEIGLEKYAYQEKYRTSFLWKNCRFDIDEYPNMPPFLEIEASTEGEIKKAIKMLKLENNKVWKDGERTLIQQEYRLNWYKMKFKN